MTAGNTTTGVDSAVEDDFSGSREDVVVYLSDHPSSRLGHAETIISIEYAASRFCAAPSLFQSFASNLPKDFRVVCAYGRPENSDSDSNVLDIIIIIDPSVEGHIFAPQSHHSENNFLRTSSELRALLSLSESKGFGSLTHRWAIGISELLQLELSNPESSDSHRRKCLRYLREVSRRYNVLPPSFLLHDLVKEGNHPIWGGGFADIWKGNISSSPVCIKVLRLFTTSNVRAQLFKEFSNEALVWKQLDHPNVLPFLGVNTELFSPSFCLISPWMENGNIISFLEKNPSHDRLGMLLEIAQGLCYLHNLNPQIIHGDIRGANIMVTSSKTCCLADFGLALVTESQTLATTSTGIQGSVRWMAPEILEPARLLGKEKIPSSRDVYAFGCTILEIFTGKPPYADIRMEVAVVTEVLKGKKPSRPEVPVAYMPDELWNLTEDCWVDYPELRPSASRIVQALTILQGIRSRTQSRASNFPIDEGTGEQDVMNMEHAPIIDPDDDHPPADSTISHSQLETLLSLRTSWLSKDFLSSAASLVSGLSLSHSPMMMGSEPALTANTSIRMTPINPDRDRTLVSNTTNSMQSWIDDNDPKLTLYDSPESSEDHLNVGNESKSLAECHLNDLMYGVSHGFSEPTASAISLRSLEVSRFMPKEIQLLYGSYEPFHIQAPNWQQLLYLLKGHPETLIDVEVPNGIMVPSEFKLRVVCQFFKPVLARHWRTVIWLTIDYPLPRMRGEDIFEEFGVEGLPRSYSFSTSATPSILQTTNKNVSMHYTIPQTKNLPYPSLPISLPDLAVYLEASMDQSRRSLNKRKRTRSWRRSRGVELLARMLDCCEDDEPYYIPEWGSSFFRKLQHALRMPRWGKASRDAVVIR